MSSPVDKPILFMDFKGPQDYSIICWSGDFDDKNLLIHTVVEGNAFENLDFHRYSSGEVVNEGGIEKVVDIFVFVLLSVILYVYRV